MRSGLKTMKAKGIRDKSPPSRESAHVDMGHLEEARNVLLLTSSAYNDASSSDA